MLCDPILPDFQTSWFFPTWQGGGQGVRRAGGGSECVDGLAESLRICFVVKACECVGSDLQSPWELLLWCRLRVVSLYQGAPGWGHAVLYSVHNCKLFVNSEAMISPVLANLQRISPARTLWDGHIRLYSKLSQILALHSASTYFFCPHWFLRAECIPMLPCIVSHWLNSLWNICKVAFWKTLLFI